MMTQRKQLYPMAIVVIAIIFGVWRRINNRIITYFLVLHHPLLAGTDQGGAKMHLGEAMKALQAGDTAGTEMHITEADKVLQEGEAKMHLGEAMKALRLVIQLALRCMRRWFKIVCS